MENRQYILKSRPVGIPGSENFGLTAIEVPSISEGEILLRAKYFSVDPYMRGRMNEGKSYIDPFEVGKALSGGVVAEVVESQNASFSRGEYVMGMLPWQEVISHSGEGLVKVNPELAPVSTALGILGMPGLTAYFGLMDIGKPKAGETVVVSGAAGAVGSLVGQIARIMGCRVVGIAGSDEKNLYLEQELGFDATINYKTVEDMGTALKDACPDGVDIYFDNVGGEISDAVIYQMNPHGRISLCGQISMYNATEMPVGPRLQPILLTRSLLMQGFIVFNYQERYPEGIQQMAKWLKEGKIKFKENVVEGFENLPEAFLGLFRGDNIGKQIVKA